MRFKPVREVPAAIAAKIPAAASVFAEHGFDDAKIDDVARSIGVPRATLYYYFSGKEDILAFLLRTLLEDVAAEVQRAVSGEGDGVARLRAALRAQLEVLAGNPETAQPLVANIGRAGRLADIAVAVNAAFHDPVITILRAGIEDGSIRGVDPERAASALFGAVILTGLHEIVLHRGLDPDDVLDDVSTVVLDGLANTKGRP
jgi:TetR/AcrR family transcriptional regulator